jgi:WD40 repeat protein
LAGLRPKIGYALVLALALMVTAVYPLLAAPISVDTLDQMKLLTTYHYQSAGDGNAIVNPSTFFSRDGSMLLEIQDTTVIIRDTISGVAKMTITVPVVAKKYILAAVRATFAPDDKTLTTVDRDKFVRFWDLSTGAQTGEFPIQGLDGNGYFQVLQPQYSPDGTRLMIGLLGYQYLIMEVKSGKTIDQLIAYGKFSFLPDGTPVTLGHMGLLDGKGAIIPFDPRRDASGNPTIGQVGVPNTDWSMMTIFDVDTMELMLWDTVARTHRETLLMYTATVVEAVFSGDSRVLASRDVNNLVILWDVQTGKKIQTLHLPTATPPTRLNSAISLNQDGSILMLRENSGFIHFWDVATDTEVSSLPTFGFSSDLNSLFISPDGSRLFSVSSPYVLVYGIPSEGQLVYTAVPVFIEPETINVRQKPSFDSAVIAYARSGLNLATGRDQSGRFVYLEKYGGWVNAGSSYINAGTLDLKQLPILNS